MLAVFSNRSKANGLCQNLLQFSFGIWKIDTIENVKVTTPMMKRHTITEKNSYIYIYIYFETLSLWMTRKRIFSFRSNFLTDGCYRQNVSHRRVSSKNLDTLFVVLEGIPVEIEHHVQSVYLTVRSAMLMSRGIYSISNVEKAKKETTLRIIWLTGGNLRWSCIYDDRHISVRLMPS